MTATRTGQRPRPSYSIAPKGGQQTARSTLPARRRLTAPWADGVELRAIHKRYKAWCAEKGNEPLSAIQISEGALAGCSRKVGIAVTEERGRLIDAGVGLRPT